jgi:cytochrome c553
MIKPAILVQSATILPCTILLWMMLAGPAAAAKSDSCAHCHGTDGNSSSSAFPSLAGQPKEYLYRQLKAFKEGQRKDSMMSPAAVVLSEQDVQELAEFYAAQSIARSSYQTDAAIVAQGKQLAGTMQCAACHQPGFKGQAEFPRLARQKYPYLVKQLKDYRDGKRASEIMAPTVKDLSDEQIKALAQYLTSL